MRHFFGQLSSLTPVDAPVEDAAAAGSPHALDAEIQEQLDVAEATHAQVQAPTPPQTRVQAAAPPRADGILWRTFERPQPGRAIDSVDALRGGAKPGAVVTEAPTAALGDPIDQVLHGYGRRTQWASYTLSPTCALLYAMWQHAKTGPTPEAPAKVRSKLRPPRARRMAGRRSAAPQWEKRYTEYVVRVETERFARRTSVVSLASASDRAAAKVRNWKAARRAGALAEVLVRGQVQRRAISGIYRVDFTAPFGARLPRFSKDYFEMVSPRDTGLPAWGLMQARLLAEFEADGARSVDGEVQLPTAMWDEFATTAQRCLG